MVPYSFPSAPPTPARREKKPPSCHRLCGGHAELVIDSRESEELSPTQGLSNYDYPKEGFREPVGKVSRPETKYRSSKQVPVDQATQHKSHHSDAKPGSDLRPEAFGSEHHSRINPTSKVELDADSRGKYRRAPKD